MLSSRPILCLVTDRRRLCAGCDDEMMRRCLAAHMREAVAAGVDMIQVRERDLDAAALALVVSDALMLARASATRVVVNDRFDVALACGAHGVHLPAGAIRPSAARQASPSGFLIGQSVHSVAEARAADGADYVIAGTVFPTASKPHEERFLGEAGLAEIVHAARMPVLGIGGVTLARTGRIAAAGAAGIAAIGLFMGGSTISPCRVAPLGERVAGIRASFGGSGAS